LPPASWLVSYLAYRSALIVEAVRSSETSANFQRITRRSPFMLNSSDEITEKKRKERKILGGCKTVFLSFAVVK
jgi:hypothetical protein